MKLKYLYEYILSRISTVLFFRPFNPYIREVAAAAKSLQSCLTLCNPIDSSPPGSPNPEILQARTLEWFAISFSNKGGWVTLKELISSFIILISS